MGKSYTPAPWWVVKNSTGTFEVKTQRDKSDMTPEEEAAAKWPYGATICSNIGDHTEKRTSGNEEANANLISAAPDMLEAITAFLADWDSVDFTEELNSEKWLLAMSNAARKARGGQS